MTIGERIKLSREKKGMTLEQLGKYVGVAAQTLSRYETGAITGIPADRIESIAKALDTTPSYLMGWEEKDYIQLSPEEEKRLDQLYDIVYGGNIGQLSLAKQILIQKIVQLDESTIDALNQIADSIMERRG